MRVVDLKETERAIDLFQFRHEIVVEMIRMNDEELKRPEEEMVVLPLKEVCRQARLNVERERRRKARIEIEER